MIAEIQFNLDRLSRSLRQYANYSDKSELEIVQKQSAKLAYNIYREMRKIMPEKGSIRAERLAALKAGQGVHVRDAVIRELMSKYAVLTTATGSKAMKKGKKGRYGLLVELGRSGKMVNFQALAVARELQVREGGRGFSAYITPRPPRSYAQVAASNTEFEISSKYGFILSMFNIAVTKDKKQAQLHWYGPHADYTSATQALSQGRQQEILNNAILATIADIQVYVDRKIKEDLRASGLS